MSASANPNIVEDGLVFMYDTGNKKSYVGEPTINYIYHQNAVAQSSYTTNFATTDGTYSAKHPKAIRAYNAAGTQLGNLYNSGVTDATNTYHAHWQYDPILKKPVVVMNDVDGQWKAKSFYTGMGSWSSYGKGYGDTYTISWLQWVDNLSKNAKAGLYCKNTSNSNGFHDGQANSASAYNTKLRTWQRVYQTYTTSNVRDLSSTYLYIYMYGHYNTRATVKVADVQFTWGDHPAQFSAEYERSATEGLLDRTGNSTIDLSNVSFDSNAEITFDGTDDRMYTSETYDLGNSFTFEFVMKPNTLKNYGDPLGASLTNTGDYGMTFVTYADGHMAFNLGNGSNGWSSTAISTSTGYLTNGTYYHITGVCELGILKLYKNGVLTHSGTTPYAFNDYSINIGNRTRTSSFYPFNGNVYMVKAYNRALTAAEILKNFNAIRSRFGI